MPVQRLRTGIDLYYESHGSGEPLVLIPATGFAADVWLSDQVPQLSRSLQVIVFDQRGVGRSSHPHGVYTIEQMASDVFELLDHLELPSAHVLGHSMGGRIGLAMALDVPERVRSLVLAASGSGPAAREGPDCVPGLPFYLVSELVEKGFEEFVRHEVMDTSTYFTDDYRARHTEHVAAFYDLVWRRHAHAHEYLRLCMARHAWEATHRLGDVAVPTLVLIGDGDVIGSNHVTQSQVLAERIPNARYEILEGQSHGFFWQAPAQTNERILRWVLAEAPAHPRRIKQPAASA
jgi:pimeloyl-ACP methyl ester carboxylesterase